MTTLKLGDSLVILKTLQEHSIDSIITDPPYGLAFMGNTWDYNVPSIEIWKECLRVLKPGGHLLSFGGTRTYHRLVVAIENAGFEIRDQIQWIYGSGFPKSLDISKAIDKEAGVEREVLGTLPAGTGPLKTGHVNASGGGMSIGTQRSPEIKITKPTTVDAQKWAGWGTVLKPANEPICLARKPLSEKTVAKNMLKYGTGGLNIDESRIEAKDLKELQKNWDRTESCNQGIATAGLKAIDIRDRAPTGRFPANILFDEAAAEVLDEQSGDSGGASRFFYVAKASKSDRGEGNSHPTVKPIKLMEYLIKLITPPHGTVLDPFMGSGSTGVAAAQLGFGFYGIEISEEYFKIAQKRISN